jgi:hypothetical protein
MSESELLELDKGLKELNLTSGDEAYKSFRQYFMIYLYNLIHPVKVQDIRLFIGALKRWNRLISALALGNEVTRKNALCRTANGLYSFPFLQFKDLLPTIQTIKMFKTSQGGSVMMSYNELGGVNAIVVSKCTRYVFNYDYVRKNVKNFIKYIVKNSDMTRVYEKKFLHDAEKIDHFLFQLYSMVDGGITSIESFLSTLHQVTMFLILDGGIQHLGTKHEIMFFIDYSNMYLIKPEELHFNTDNVKIVGNIQGLIDELSLIDKIIERQAQKDKQEQRPQINMNQIRLHDELARIRALPQQPQQALSDAERQRNADKLVAHDIATAKPISTKEEVTLASNNGIEYSVFQMLFKCSFSELFKDADTISKCSDSVIYQYLSNSNLSKYMKFTELNAKYLLIVGYLKNKLRNSFLLCGRSALQMNCVLLDNEITQTLTQEENFFIAFQKPCTDFDCQFVIPSGSKPKQTFMSVYNLFLKGHDIFMAHDNCKIPQSDFYRIQIQNKQILEIRSEHSDKTIKVKESDGHLFHSVCDITFVPTSSVTPLIELFLTNPANLTLSGIIFEQPKLTELTELTKLDISFQFPSNHSLLFECVGIVDSILHDFQNPQSEEKEKLQFFYLLKFASRACQCAYLISIETRRSVTVSVILLAESNKFENVLIFEILKLFLEINSSGLENLNNLAYIAFQSYKANGTINKLIVDVYGTLLKTRENLTFSLDGGKMVKNINKKIKNTKKYKRINKKYHSKYKNNNMTNKKCHTRRKNTRIKHFIINF